MFVEKLPSKLTITRDLNDDGFIVQEDETPFGQKNFNAPIFKLTETVEDGDGNEHTAVVDSTGYNSVIGFVNTVLKEMFGTYGFTVSKATTEWSVE